MNLKEVIYENHIKSYTELINQQKKKQKKEKILTYFVAIAIIGMFITILLLNSKLENGAIKSCISKGHSESYCIDHA